MTKEQIKNLNWPPQGEVDSELTYNKEAMSFQPEDIIKAITDFDNVVPGVYQGLLLVPKKRR